MARKRKKTKSIKKSQVARKNITSKFGKLLLRQDKLYQKSVVTRDTFRTLKSTIKTIKDTPKRIFSTQPVRKKRLERTQQKLPLNFEKTKIFKGYKELICARRVQRRLTLFKLRKIGKGKGGSKLRRKFNLNSRVSCRR